LHENFYLRIKENISLLRDPNTNSIINSNMSDYQNYLERKKMKSKENQKTQNYEEDLANMKSDIEEIKNLLRSILNEPR
jgi:hypothetical protein